MADLTAMLQAAAGAGGEYQISRSLRFNSADSAYLSRTFASAGDRRTFTWSGWYKRTKLTQSGAPGLDELFVTGATDGFAIRFNTDDTIRIYNFSAGFQLNLITSAVYRDASSWYHVVVAIDTTQATNTNRAKLYVNGTQVTAFGTAVYPTQNTDLLVNQAIQHSIGSNLPWGGSYADCYMTEINFIDGQALTPSSFGETNETTGVWSPIKFNGPWNVGTGVNGFYLNFSDNSDVTAATLGADYSGNGNNWTPSGFSAVTAGAGNDSLVDTPTQYGTDTGAGGEVRGNYATFNPLAVNANSGQVTFSNGNLNLVYSSTATYSSTIATIGVSSGKWYWEVTQTASSQAPNIGVVRDGDSLANYVGQTANGYSYYGGGNKYNNAIGVAYGASFAANDVIGVALDMDAGTITFYKNGVSQGQAYSGLSGLFYPAVSDGDSSATVAFDANFGQRPFAYTAPSGFKALVTTNLPDPTVVQGDDYFNTVLYTGDGSNPRGITGVGFQPDFVWLKNRSAGWGHRLSNAVVGANYALETNNTNAELFQNQYGYLTSFNSDGFTVTAGVTDDFFTNNSGDTYVAWNWKADGAGVSNTDGTIPGTVTVSANTTAGISIVTYTGNNTAGATVGHGLGSVPSWMIVKRRTGSASDDWLHYHVSLGATKSMAFDTAVATTSSTRWNDTTPSSAVLTIGNSTGVNASGSPYVAYCFAEVEGFSKFGSYTGNGSADGPFVYTGFRPAWVMIKGSGQISNWQMLDTARNPFNAAQNFLRANSSNAEASLYPVDINSNGFKTRTTDSDYNTNVQNYIYMAFAENPFKYSLAR
jgi:hypothetical protein